MDLRDPVHAIVPTLEGPVLIALSSTSMPLTLADLHRLVPAGSKSGIRQALVRLCRQGTVEGVPGGYLLNRDHVCAPALEMLMGVRAEIADRARQFVAAWKPKPLLLGFFGSYARRDGDVDSDIDVLLVTRSSLPEGSAGGLASSLGRWTGNECHVVALTLDELNSMIDAAEPIVEEWRRELDVVVGTSRHLRPQS